jgi:DNA-directed RNA polymerase alpha subunit
MTVKKIKQKNATRVVGKVIRKDHEVWHVASDGRVRSITTRRASARAMDEAMVIYGQALQRLANR